MKKSVKIFWLFTKSSVKAYLSSPVGVLLFTIGKLLRFLLFLFFIIFLVVGTKTLKGYSPQQAIIFFLTFNLVDTLAQFLFREVYRFRSLIVTGEFDFVLLKPYHPFIKILLGGIDILDFFILICYLPLTTYLIFRFGFGNLYLVSLYFILIINGIIIATAFHILVLALGILTTEVDHTVMIYRDITSVGRFPMEIYGKNIRAVLTFIIPVAIMVWFPSKALFGLINLSTILLIVIFSIFIFFVCLKIWSKALFKYQSWGG